MSFEPNSNLGGTDQKIVGLRCNRLAAQRNRSGGKGITHNLNRVDKIYALPDGGNPIVGSPTTERRERAERATA